MESKSKEPAQKKALTISSIGGKEAEQKNIVQLDDAHC